MAPIWHLHVNGRAIPTTGGHPFWVRGQGWTTVAELRPGQELRTGQGGWVKVGEVVDTGRSAPVYNLEVEADHTYFVGDPVTWGFSLWAHNGCQTYNQLRRQTAGANQQAHHLIEKRFAGVMGQKQGQMLAVPLSPTEHQVFTNAWRAEIPYGSGTANATRETVEAAARKIYADFPEYLAALGL
jgi:hypothetical protein